VNIRKLSVKTEIPHNVDQGCNKINNQINHSRKSIKMGLYGPKTGSKLGLLRPKMGS
jgi:hypothetical protein